jgi:hypothetical protein
MLLLIYLCSNQGKILISLNPLPLGRGFVFASSPLHGTRDFSLTAAAVGLRVVCIAKWTSTGLGKCDIYDEEDMTLLPGGKVLDVDAYVFKHNPAGKNWERSIRAWAPGQAKGVLPSSRRNEIHHLLAADHRVVDSDGL